jgi:hypothetical protein
LGAAEKEVIVAGIALSKTRSKLDFLLSSVSACGFASESGLDAPVAGCCDGAAGQDESKAGMFQKMPARLALGVGI